ncbi:hypothetical protein IFM89_005141, partial [Coptis chinensis]
MLQKFPHSNDVDEEFQDLMDASEKGRKEERPIKLLLHNLGELGYQVFEGVDGGVGSLIKWNPVANVDGRDIWNFLRAMDVLVNTLHSQGYVSIGCEPCTTAILPGQHEREGRWWWEDTKAKECGLHKGNIKQEYVEQANGAALTNGNAI